MKKIFLFATLITGLFSSIAVMAQKKKAQTKVKIQVLQLIAMHMVGILIWIWN